LSKETFQKKTLLVVEVIVIHLMIIWKK